MRTLYVGDLVCHDRHAIGVVRALFTDLYGAIVAEVDFGIYTSPVQVYGSELALVAATPQERLMRGER